MTPFEYHQRTKHHLNRYARSLGYLDWSNQPDPFRSYEGAPRTPLPRELNFPDPPFDDLATARLDPEPVCIESLSRFLLDSMALSAWKQAGSSRWALRVNPSSGNLHPTEAYLLLGGLDGELDSPGLFHYQPKFHALERRREYSPPAWMELTKGLPEGSFLVGLTSILWREAWKYGERAFRYCQHDVGHALACLTLSAATLGWKTRVLSGLDDESLGDLLGVSKIREPESEHPDLLMLIEPGTREPGETVRAPDPDSLLGLIPGELLGDPLGLSREHHPWPILTEVAEATRRDRSLPSREELPERDVSRKLPPCHRGARGLFFQRRSAQAFDGRTPLPDASFRRMLEAIQPHPGRRPFEALPAGPYIHPVFFLHRVEGWEPGLYFLPRRPGVCQEFQIASGESFLFDPVEDSELLCLRHGEVAALARKLSCHQEIASDGAFAVAMLGEFDRALEQLGPWGYRHLHWEAGALGQVLYLEAEAAGRRGTGIGCFFDDSVHDLLGLGDTTFQSIYHFTVGTPVHDPRLQTIPAYEHLEASSFPE